MKLQKLIKGLLIAAAIVLLILFLLIRSGFNWLTDEQRGIDLHCRQQFNTAQDLYESGEYQEALVTLDSISENWTSYDKCADLRCDILRDYLVDIADTTAPEELLQLIVTNIAEEDVFNDEQIYAVYDAASRTFRTKVLEEAEKVYDGGTGFLDAVNIVNDALSTNPYDEILKKEMEAYVACQPQNLAHMEPYHQASGIYGSMEEFTTVDGETYSTGMHGIWYADEPGDNEAIWHIDGEYDVLTAKAVVLASDYNAAGTAKITIKGDDKVLYTKTYNKDSEAFDIRVPITNVTNLSITLEGGGSYDYNGMFCQLADVYVAKTKAKTVY